MNISEDLMPVSRGGIALATTLTLSAGFAASAFEKEADDACISPKQPCQLTYFPVSPLLPDQPHTETGENIPLIGTTLSTLSVSGGPMSNVHAQTIMSSSQPAWILESPASSFDNDQCMAARFRDAGINVTVRQSPSKSSDSPTFLAWDQEDQTQSSA